MPTRCCVLRSPPPRRAPTIANVGYNQPLAHQHRGDGGTAVVPLLLRVEVDVLPICLGICIRHRLGQVAAEHLVVEQVGEQVVPNKARRAGAAVPAGKGCKTRGAGGGWRRRATDGTVRGKGLVEMGPRG